jgi:hypothetical protein
VDIYPKFKSHCMEMKVQIKTEVDHGEYTDKHDSPEVNMGCDNTWFVKGDDGNKIPQYLEPAIAGVLTKKSQTTKGDGRARQR